MPALDVVLRRVIRRLRDALPGPTTASRLKPDPSSWRNAAPAARRGLRPVSPDPAAAPADFTWRRRSRPRSSTCCSRPSPARSASTSRLSSRSAFWRSSSCPDHGPSRLIPHARQPLDESRHGPSMVVATVFVLSQCSRLPAPRHHLAMSARPRRRRASPPSGTGRRARKRSARPMKLKKAKQRADYEKLEADLVAMAKTDIPAALDELAEAASAYRRKLPDLAAPQEGGAVGQGSARQGGARPRARAHRRLSRRRPRGPEGAGGPDPSFPDGWRGAHQQHPGVQAGRGGGVRPARHAGRPGAAARCRARGRSACARRDKRLGRRVLQRGPRRRRRRAGGSAREMDRTPRRASWRPTSGIACNARTIPSLRSTPSPGPSSSPFRSRQRGRFPTSRGPRGTP